MNASPWYVKNLFILLFCLSGLGISGLFSQEIRAPKSIDIGLVPPNSKKLFNVALSNPEKFPQRINISTDCGCMAAQRFIELEPDEEGSVTVEFSSTGFPRGKIKRQIVLFTEGAQNRFFVDVTGEVGTVMTASAKEARFANISRNRHNVPVFEKLILSGRGDAPIFPVLANITATFIEAEVVQLTKFYWELRLSLLPHLMPIGELSGAYKLVVRDELNGQFLEIPVIWTKKTPIKFDPNPLFIYAGPGEEFSARLNYTIANEAKVVSVKIESAASIKYKLEKGAILLEGIAPENAEKAINGYITVVLDDIDDPEHGARFVIAHRSKV
jgi:hypothetical protein